ncbi:carbohydrate esterase family 1 protein [Durotheca rogersii]|uniref:carbohydrate esterase family 1 protein n=1 Tax=Durotheca rogersii TaxID=419775 RepID=UPI002220D5BE|nr:carbohydrate esterase family 1 protein [Durotheca rogersii]KAI5867258.1 carbohydrate esterase family 1 protein [Durotheca rogersii]
MRLSIYTTAIAAAIITGAFAAPARADDASVSAAAGTAGCSKPHPFPSVPRYRSIASGGRSRSYSLHLPSNFSENTPYPVVLGFHGSSSIGLFFEVDTKLSESRFSANKIMVYPNGVGGAWAGANYSEISVDEDLQFVSDLLDDLRAEYCVDESRIYATGMSNGGGFVNTIACSAAGAAFAAFAAASGSFYTDSGGAASAACAPARAPLPLLEIHGAADASVRYAGGAGEGGALPPVAEWLARWAARNACGDGAPASVDLSFGGKVRRERWTCGGAEGVVEHWRVEDMGHCWASTEINFSQIAAGEGPTYIQASRIIMDFFDRFAKP